MKIDTKWADAACAPNRSSFFSFEEGGAVGFFEYFWFSMCSHQVPTVFTSSSQSVLNRFTKFLMPFPIMFPKAPHFIPYALPSNVLLEPICLGQYWVVFPPEFPENTWKIQDVSVMSKSKRVIARKNLNFKLLLQNSICMCLLFPPPTHFLINE